MEYVNSETTWRARESADRTLIVANRLPTTGVVKGAELKVRPSNGGLATGLARLSQVRNLTWVGWHGYAAAAGASLAPDTDGVHVSIPLSEEEIGHFYRQYCNSILWPLLHGFDDIPKPTAEQWHTYGRVNERYAEAVSRCTKHHSRIWIHDYHLMPLPELLKQRSITIPTGFFLHTPFPDPCTFMKLEQGPELIRGMLGADIIGFHTEQFAANFLRAAESCGFDVRHDTVQVDGREVRISARPMGIDVEAFEHLGSRTEVLAEAARMRQPGVALLLGVDRLDYTKGIPQRLLAFEQLLARCPAYRKRVNLVQVAVPSREEVAAYQDLRAVVEEIVTRINRTYGTAAWTPVSYLYGTVDLHTLAALYRAADVMLVTSRADGLNLVAKEFVATRTDDDGVLILSKFTGAASELHPALQVDPNRIDELSDAIKAGLSMPTPERAWRMKELRRIVSDNDVFQWADYYLDSLLAEAPYA